MSRYYNHTQTGCLLLYALGAALLLITSIMLFSGFNWVAFVVIFILIATMLTFSNLNVTINDKYLEIRFGLGLIRKKFLLKDIESCCPVKTHWYYGWGIHFTPHGLLFNVSGFHAVKLNVKNGKKYLIGTDEPRVLSDAINESIKFTSK